MTISTLFRQSALKGHPLGLADWRLPVFSAVFALGNLTVPMLLHGVPNGGQIFLPLFFFTLVAAWQFGLWSGLLVAVASPLLSHLLTGMPLAAMLPVVLTKSVALALAAAGLARATRKVHFLGILGTVLAMQAAGFLAERFAGLPVPASLNMLRMSLPGMAIMVIGGWAALRLINRFVAPAAGQAATPVPDSREAAE